MWAIPMYGAAAPQAPALIVPASLAGLSIIPAGMWDARRRRGFTTSVPPFPRSRPSPATLYFLSALTTLPGCPMWGCMWEIRSCCTAATPFPTRTSIQATGSSIFIVTEDYQEFLIICLISKIELSGIQYRSNVYMVV